MSVYSAIIDKKSQGKKQLAVLIDPDKHAKGDFENIARIASEAGVDYFFVGGSLLITDQLENCVKALKANSSIPTVLFPGNTVQISWKADAILFLSLISGRNAEMLIGRHVISAPYLKISPLEVISCGYMLIESGKQTAVQYMSNTTPLPADKDDIAMCTAIAGEMLGLKLIYLEAGSGAINPVPVKMIEAVRSSISIPLIVGGGIRTPEKALEQCHAGADLLVVGNAIEKQPSLISEIAVAVHGV